MDWTALTMGTVGAVSAVAYALRRGDDEPILRAWLQRILRPAPWDLRRGLSLGLQAAALSPTRADRDRVAVGSAAAGVAGARVAVGFAATGRLALAGMLLLAALFARSVGLWLVALAAALVAVAAARATRSERARAALRLAGTWLLAGIVPAGLAQLGEVGRLVLAPWSPLLDAFVFTALGATLRVAGVRLPLVLLPAAGLAGAGWLGTQATLGLLAGGHLGAAVRQVRLGWSERDEARLAAHGSAVLQAAQGLLVFLATLAALPALAQSTGSPVAATLALFLGEFCAWAAVTATWYTAGAVLDEALRVRLAEGEGTGVPSLSSAPLIVEGATWRARRLDELAERFCRPRSEPLSQFKIDSWVQDAERLMGDLESLRARASTLALNPDEAGVLSDVIRAAAQARGRIEHWLARHAQALGSSGSPGSPGPFEPPGGEPASLADRPPAAEAWKAR